MLHVGNGAKAKGFGSGGVDTGTGSSGLGSAMGSDNEGGFEAAAKEGRRKTSLLFGVTSVADEVNQVPGEDALRGKRVVETKDIIQLACFFSANDFYTN